MASFLDYLLNARTTPEGGEWSGMPGLLAPQQRVDSTFNPRGDYNAPSLLESFMPSQSPPTQGPPNMPPWLAGAQAPGALAPPPTAAPVNIERTSLENSPLSLAPPQPGASFAPQAAPQAPQGGGFGNRLMMALQALGNPQAPFTYNALRESGVPHPQALLQATSLETAQANMPTWGIIAQDDFGNNKYGWINRATGQIAVPGAGPGGVGPGVTEAMDKDGNPLMGQPYLQHLEKNSPTMASAVKGALAGNLNLTGRKLQMAIAAASRVEEGFDMNIFNGRKALVIDAKKSTPNSFGGQRGSGNTAIEHLGELSSYAKALENFDAGIPLLSHSVNWLKQNASTDQASAANKLNDAVDRYVAEVAKFYAGSNTGGVAERDAARNRFSSIKSGKELAGAIEAERDLFIGKMKQLQAHRDETFPDQEHADKLVGPVLRPASTEAIDKINNNISALKGNTAQAAPGGPKIGAVSKGYRFKGGDPSKQENWEAVQ